MPDSIVFILKNLLDLLLFSLLYHCKYNVFAFWTIGYTNIHYLKA